MLVIFAAPHVAPHNITTSWKSPSVLTIRWSLLTLNEARGTVVSYTVVYTSMKTGIMQEQLLTIVAGGHENAELDLRDLNEGTSYLVQMWASTRAGPGQTSPAIIGERA